jgi:hypothetical protein
MVIRGGAGEYEAVAIVAVIQNLLDEETAARNQPPAPNRPSAWVRLGAPTAFGRFTSPVLPESRRRT